ncbi:DNA-binding protein WhiA [Christensenellaceae bacterium OttesenSCG-928-L17]|nr:DNA-binding protein WhiA [Christensenellaceae bacterium OttesenSCG-928-L17]
MISFSGKVKQELARIRLRGAAVCRAQLFGLTQAAGTLKLSGGMEYVTETREVAEQAAKLAAQLYDAEAVLVSRAMEHRKLPLIVAALRGGRMNELPVDAGMITCTEEGVSLERRIPLEELNSESTQRAFLRGVFLGAGSVSSPARAYHLEIVCASETLAAAVQEMLCAFDCNAKSVRRKNKHVVYLKEGDAIATFLALMGASVATMEFESVRATKETNNYINRAANCDNANIDKTVSAAAEQTAAIQKILASPRAQKRLSPVLRETAELRLNYPELSLSELAALASVGRSGMNHRLQRLLDIAREMD